MATITKSQIKVAFALAGALYDGKLKFETAAELQDHHGLNINSARDFLSQYRHMLHGEVFKRSLSGFALEYFLPGIERSRGRDAADNAIAATWKHIAYYEALEDTRLAKLRSVAEEFQASFGGPVSAQVQESTFNAAVVQSTRDPPATRKKRLEKANATPTVIIAQTKVYVRNPDVVAEVLARANGVCELCKKPAPFVRKTDGTPYLEVHHKEEVGLDKPVDLPVHDIEVAIEIATRVDEARINYNFAFDRRAYEAVRRGLSQLVEKQKIEEAKALALTLMRKGSYQIECSDEGLMQEEIETCLRPVISAATASSGDRDWAREMLRCDRTGCICRQELTAQRHTGAHR